MPSGSASSNSYHHPLCNFDKIKPSKYFKSLKASLGRRLAGHRNVGYSKNKNFKNKHLLCQWTKLDQGRVSPLKIIDDNNKRKRGQEQSIAATED